MAGVALVRRVLVLVLGRSRRINTKSGGYGSLKRGPAGA